MPESRPFALATVDAGDGPYAGMLIDDRVLDLRPHFGSDVSLRGLLADWAVNLLRLQHVADRAGMPVGDRVDGLSFLAPIQPPGQIFQAGANYRQHVLDLMAAAENRGDASDGLTSAARDDARRQLDQRLQHGRPFVFLGSAHAMVGARDDVVLPAGSDQPDWELELAAVIGHPARRVPADRALDVVAGYMIANDVTSRDVLRRDDATGLGLDWLAGKNSPTFLPTGPWFVPAIHAGDPMNLTIELSVNDRMMQNESTSDMVFGVAALIEYISSIAQLRPGDVVLTGSPAGNGASHGVFLKPGDVMTGRITGLGTQVNRCVAEDVSDGSSNGSRLSAAAPEGPTA